MAFDKYAFSCWTWAPRGVSGLGQSWRSPSLEGQTDAHTPELQVLTPHRDLREAAGNIEEEANFV